MELICDCGNKERFNTIDEELVKKIVLLKARVNTQQ